MLYAREISSFVHVATRVCSNYVNAIKQLDVHRRHVKGTIDSWLDRYLARCTNAICQLWKSNISGVRIVDINVARSA